MHRAAARALSPTVKSGKPGLPSQPPNVDAFSAESSVDPLGYARPGSELAQADVAGVGGLARASRKS